MAERNCYTDILIDSIHERLERGEVEAAWCSAARLRSVEEEEGEFQKETIETCHYQ